MNKTYALMFVGVILFLPACVSCRSDLDAGRIVTIEGTSPQPRAKTGLRVRFSVLLRDSFEMPSELQVYASIDDGAAEACTLDTTPTNTIDETVTESIFRCHVDTEALPAGEHSVRYWVIDRDDRTADQRSIGFAHDPEPPELHASTTSLGAGARLKWTVSDRRDFTELTAHINGVRVFTSHAPVGDVLLDQSVAPKGAAFELRAFDRVRNVATQTLTIN